MGWLSKMLGGGPKVFPTNVGDPETFRAEVLESDVPVIVDVWSSTCAPCKQLEPVLVRVATKYAGRVKVAELSTSADPQVLGRLGVRATPTLLIFDGGKEVGRVSGFRPESWFDEMIEAEFPDPAEA